MSSETQSQPLTSSENFARQMKQLFEASFEDYLCVIDSQALLVTCEIAGNIINENHGHQVSTGAELLDIALDILMKTMDDPRLLASDDQHSLSHIGSRLGEVAGCLLDECEIQKKICSEAQARWKKLSELFNRPNTVVLGIMGSLGSLFGSDPFGSDPFGSGPFGSGYRRRRPL